MSVVVSTGDYIDNIHELWWGNYNHLEWDHSYIGWLFPIREKGLNMHAHELQLHEAKVRRLHFNALISGSCQHVITVLTVNCV